MAESNAVVGIRPAEETLRDLNDGRHLDELAQSINRACAEVRAKGKPAKVIMTITIAPGSNQKLVDPPVAFFVEVAEKLPKVKPVGALMYLDSNDNPSPFPTAGKRERGLDFGISSGGSE